MDEITLLRSIVSRAAYDAECEMQVVEPAPEVPWHKVPFPVNVFASCVALPITARVDSDGVVRDWTMAPLLDDADYRLDDYDDDHYDNEDPSR